MYALLWEAPSTLDRIMTVNSRRGEQTENHYIIPPDNTGIIDRMMSVYSIATGLPLPKRIFKPETSEKAAQFPLLSCM